MLAEATDGAYNLLKLTLLLLVPLLHYLQLHFAVPIQTESIEMSSSSVSHAVGFQRVASGRASMCVAECKGELTEWVTE
jgi:hypothetical protein